MTTLYFTPSAYQKAMFFLQKEVEVGGFCITDKEQPNLIIDFQILHQECTVVTTEFDKDRIDDYINEMLDFGYDPSQCFRLWTHFHPSNSPDPSSTDWTTFNDLMKSYPWFGMLIFAKDQSYFGYVKTTQGVGLEDNVDIEVDWTYPCEVVDFSVLEDEYQEKVRKPAPKPIKNYGYEGWKPQVKAPWDLEDRWSKPVHNYMNSKEELAEEFGVDEDELDEMFEDYLKGSLHRMTDTQFQEWEKNEQ